MRILVLGSGGREHALSWKLAEGHGVEKVWVLPGNPGMKDEKTIPLCEEKLSIENTLMICDTHGIDLVVVGPDQLLADGYVDALQDKVKVLGPTQAASQLESSKAYAKEFMREFNIPTADFDVYDDWKKASDEISKYDFQQGIAVKADELAAGKGVVVTHDEEEAKKTLYNFMANPSFSVKTKRVVIEKKLEGKEVSVFALCDGEKFVTLGYVCDHKRLQDADQGPNTGGMGCYTPRAWPTPVQKSFIETRILNATLQGMQKRGRPYRGILYVGLMINGDDINVIEYNARFGDPEAQTLLPLAQSDLAEWFEMAAKGKLSLCKKTWSLEPLSCVHVVLSSQGYPALEGESLKLGQVITFSDPWLLDNTDSSRQIFFAGVKEEGGRLVNSGGRVLGVTVKADNLEEAREECYRIVEGIHFEGRHFRKDIGQKGRL